MHICYTMINHSSKLLWKLPVGLNHGNQSQGHYLYFRTKCDWIIFNFSGAGVLLEGTFHKKGKHIIVDSKGVKVS